MHTPSKNHPVPVVVYGTLRTGGSLKGYYFPGLQGEPVEIVDHALRFNDAIPFPFLVPSEGSTAVGEVYWVSDPQMLAAVTDMEESVGYETGWVSVRSSLHDVQYQARAFIWQGDTAHGVTLQDVPAGDWVQHALAVGVAR